MNNKKTSTAGRIIRALILVLLFWAFWSLLTNPNQSKTQEMSYSQMYTEFQNDNVESVTLQPNESNSVISVTGQLKEKDDKGNPIFFHTIILNDPTTLAGMQDVVQTTNVTILEPPALGPIMQILVGLLPIALIIGFFYLMMKNATGSNDKAMNFGKSKARRSQHSPVKFMDVAGYEEEKEELKEVVDFLKKPLMFNEMGARIPKGVLLVGPPGTGKTLLARSVAGEASVPFFSVSGSDFVEMFVGVGASRVRDMFNEAKKNAPCIIFIDEIDAVGRQRGAGMGGGNDEREQTLNQLLVEMDGFGVNTGIILLAATNRPDVLDPALLRPGRFDRQVTVDLPDVQSRELILELHASKKKLSEDIKLADIAKRTPGFSGADLENILNEAAIMSVRHNKKEIDSADLSEGIDRVVAGPAKKNRTTSEKERKLVAFHESGHVIIGLELDSADMVEKVTIVPRGRAGGYAVMVPREDRFFSTKTELLDKITGLLAGRAAEEIFLKDVSTGAHNDFERASKIARAMVTEYGMSKLGTRQFEQGSKDVFLGRDYGKERAFSDGTATEIDHEVNRILDECYKNAKKILTKRKKDMNLLANALLEVETLDGEEIKYLIKNGKLLKRKEANTYSNEELKAIASHHEKIDALKKETFRLSIDYNKVKYNEKEKDKEQKLESIMQQKNKIEQEIEKLQASNPLDEIKKKTTTKKVVKKTATKKESTKKVVKKTTKKKSTKK